MKINYKESRPSLLLYIFALLAAIYLIAPILIILPLSLSSSRYLKFPPPGWSLEWYKAFFTDPVWMSSLANSFKIGIVASIVATVVGTAAAYGFVRGRIKGQKIIVAFILSPMIVPIIVTAISLYGFYALIGVVGGFWGILIGHTVFVTPLVLISVIANLQRFDPVYEQASLSLGAGPFRTFVKVTFPNIIPGVLSGGLFAFIMSFDELVIAMFVGGSTMTLPRKIWDDLVVMIEPTQAAASVVLIAMSTVVLLLWLLVQRRD